MGRAAEPITRAAAMYFTYVVAIMNGVLFTHWTIGSAQDRNKC